MILFSRTYRVIIRRFALRTGVDVSVPILVTAFCRPELTIQALESLIYLRPNSNIIVSQDGRIPGYYEAEHADTRNRLLKFSKQHSQVQLNLRDINQGLTQHLFDIFEMLFQNFSSIIFLEEDMRICQIGLSFLEATENDLGISHRTAFSSTGHPGGVNSMAFRLSYFPEQWGISINYDAFQAFSKEFRMKRVDRSVVRRVISQVKFGKLKSEFLTDFWTQLLRDEIESPHGWDALLQWTLWQNEVPSKILLENHVTDLGGDVGAITSRRKIESLQINSKFSHTDLNGVLCEFCEQQDAARRKFSALSQLRTRTRLRTRVKTFVEAQKYKYGPYRV